MKVYFEETGFGHGKCFITVFVSPKEKDRSTEAYQYNPEGKKFSFFWADPIKSRCYDSKELPKIMWDSIRYGCCDMEVDWDKDGYRWNIDDLEYNPVNMTEINAYKKAMKLIGSVKTLDDFKELYPTIKKSNRISQPIINKFFEVVGTRYPDVYNGEIGIAFMQGVCLYKYLLGEIGLEPKIEYNERTT